MMVKCISNNCSSLPEELLVPGTCMRPDEQVQLKVGEYYTVYAMTLRYSFIWYYIMRRKHNCKDYPFAWPAPFFEVVSGEMSKYWVYSFEYYEEQKNYFTEWAFPEWANDPYYYSGLADGDEEEVAICQKYIKLMDVEFPNPTIKDSAVIYDQNWIGCPFCIDAWEYNSEDAMSICPNCQRMLHNPIYKRKPWLEGIS